MKKSVIAIISTAVIFVSLLAPLITTVQATTDPSSWYKTVTGVLSSDYYTLYPYETSASLKIGFSKFGEMINSNDNTGLELTGSFDPFAPGAGSGLTAAVPKNLWVQGWLINITYRHRTLGDRNVWATAIFSDSINYGNDWIRVDFANDKDISFGLEDAKDPGSLIYGTAPYSTAPTNWGGRKTNGTCVTDPITVLYDGPREFIGLCRTTVYDHPIMLSNDTTGDVPLVQIAITIRFDKVKKDVVLLKDIKSLIPLKEGEKMKIQFSNRGEVDLGNDAVGYASYMHFYTQGLANFDAVVEGRGTYYDDNWTALRTEDPLDTEYPGYSAAGPYPQTSPGAATYDVAQAINPEAFGVWFAAFWPSLSDWSIDGWDNWWHSLSATDPHYIDMRVPTDEPSIPFYIGEWDFVLWHTTDSQERTQFRGVTVYGVVYKHNADDANMGATHSNVIDNEVAYYCNEQFNPWDLSDAVWYKNTARWVKFVPGPKSAGSSINLGSVYNAGPWDSYNDDSEKLITLPDKILWRRDVNYTLTATGVTLINSLPGGKTLKILWANQSYEIVDGNTFGPRRYEWVTVGRDAATVDSAGAALITAAIKQKNSTIGLAGEDMYETMLANSIPFVMSKFGAGNTMADYKDTLGRAGLADDWCTYWPVASSNMIASGGPLANMLAYYANDFTDAFYGIPAYSGTAYSGKVVPITCWDRAWPTTDGLYHTYASDNSTGYAVISTYLDINGTVIFEVWGHWGRDTLYASQWLHGDVARAIPPGIVQLQSCPWGLTSIILKINYADPSHPTFSIVECLGTISETLWTHRYNSPFTGREVTEVKGGIHDP